MTDKHNTYTIMGYDVQFPENLKPFPAQFAVMNKILTALKKSQHALLESPTGSGKTLALLCATLAWQEAKVNDLIIEAKKKRILQETKRVEGLKKVFSDLTYRKNEPVISCSADSDFMDITAPNVSTGNKIGKHSRASVDSSCEMQLQYEVQAKLELEEGLEFQTAHKFKRPRLDDYSMDEKDITSSSEMSNVSIKPEVKNEVHRSEVVRNLNTKLSKDTLPEDQIAGKKVPTIFYATRTHSQIAQIVKEFKRCPEMKRKSNNLKRQMTIMGSRNQYCINREAKQAANINDACGDLVDRGNCTCKSSMQNINGHLSDIWDIEEIVSVGEERNGCPYFYSKSLLSVANIIFCPYNYLMDAGIRKSMDFSLENAIIVLDEAHNIETVCRDSASFELTEDEILLAIKGFEACLKYKEDPKYRKLKITLEGLVKWMISSKKELKAVEFQKESKVWLGAEILSIVKEFWLIDPQNVESHLEMLEDVRLMENENKATGRDKKKAKDVPLSSVASSVIGQVLLVCKYLCSNKLARVSDYRLVLLKQRVANKWITTACLWCLNPAVAFQEVANQAQSIILTSGTLSPMDSFAGELGVEFPVQLEANHVINVQKQLWVGSIQNGPQYVELIANYKNQQSLAYQDALGKSILEYSKVIPGGVLVFLPSYFLMEKLLDRWDNTGLHNEMSQIKDVYSEPRKTGQELDEMLTDFKASIYRGGQPGASISGAVLFAVYRGKISEGIDFSDDYARAVLVVGIPYPAFKDMKVQFKKAYQDSQPPERNLLNGKTWYSHVAFRALNQALGRCIRHRNDFGAIILLDARFANTSTTRQLSKWVRNHVQSYHSTQDSISSVQAFFQRLEGTYTRPVRQLASSEGKKSTNAFESMMKFSLKKKTIKAFKLPARKVVDLSE